MAEITQEEYWNKFSFALKPNTLVKAKIAAQRAREKQKEANFVVVDLPEDDENGNIQSPEVPRMRSKRINPQQVDKEESCGNFNGGRNIFFHDINLSSLTIANTESQKCLQCLIEVSDGLSDLSDANETEKRKKSKSISNKDKDVESGGVDTKPFIQMAEHMVKQTKDSFVIAYKLNESAVGFHVAEDFLRDPQKISLLDFSAKGRIRIPTVEYVDASFALLGQLLNDCLGVVDSFEENHPKEKSMISLLNVFAKGVRHLETSAESCKQVFESLLYVRGADLEMLQKFIFILNSIERSDIIMEVQSLRRKIDEITIALEKLSWKSHLILHRGKGFPVRDTTATFKKKKTAKSKTTSSKTPNVKNKTTGPSNKTNNAKKIKTKPKRKKTVVDQFIKNQKKLLSTDENIVHPDLVENGDL